ncbi:putative calcium-binding protein CML31 [Curcuma longa]|uniref:putative calcium-binding protein CML31 n=1 Tax=Curcuma longa TaxID=136217 RepID=UPI003D9DBC24
MDSTIPKKKERAGALPKLITLFCGAKSPPKKQGKTEAEQSPPPPPSSTIPASLPAASISKSSSLHHVFCYFDENGDGKISATELQSCMRSIGEELSHEDAVSVVESSDSDGDGLLGFDDFVRLVEGEESEEKEKNLREAFKVYQEAGDGCITPKSLRRALGKLGEAKSVEECRVMIRRYDINGDGVITFDEFRMMML